MITSGDLLGCMVLPTMVRVLFPTVSVQPSRKSMSLIEFIVAVTRLLVLLSMPLWVPGLAHAQLWSGILDRSRAIDWRAINPGALSINESRTQCGPTLLPSGKDDTAAI